MAAKKRRKKKDPFYKAILWVLIACGAVLLYENLNQIGKKSESAKVIQKTSTGVSGKIEKSANLKANQDWDQTTLNKELP